MGRINYKLKQYKNKNSEYNNFYYPRAVLVGTLRTNELAELISKRCTITKADVLGCLAALSEVMNEQITDSKKVYLAGIGIFGAKIKTKQMVENLEDFKVNECVAGYGINFLPEFTVDASGRRTTKLLVGAALREADNYASGVNDTSKGKPIKIGQVA